MNSPLIAANLFQLSGSSLHVTYSTSGINGKPLRASQAHEWTRRS